MTQSVQKRPDKGKLVRRSVAISAALMIAGSGVASAFDLPGPLKNVWNSTVGRISSTFTSITNEYLGSLIDEYLPQGISMVFGELGLPDPASIFAGIRSDAKDGSEDVNFFIGDTDLNLDPIAGERKINSVAGDLAEATGSAYFSEEAQKANADANQAMLQTVEGSGAIAEDVQKRTKTQEILKLNSQQLHQLTAAMANVSQRIEQGNQQQGGQTIALSTIAKNGNEKLRRDDVESQIELEGVAGSASFLNGVLDKD